MTAESQPSTRARVHRGSGPSLICSTREAHWRNLFRADDMNPDRALAEQIKRYRGMTGEQRLALALELHEMSCDIAREGIRRQHPKASPAEVERLLRRRLELARAA
jgi:hypothetical protein